MKRFAWIWALSLVTPPAFAAVDCTAKVKTYIRQGGGPSDSGHQIKDVVFLKAGESHEGIQKNIGPFDQDVVVYMVHGSYHSGYFIDAYILEPQTCRLMEKVNFYGE